MRRGQYCTPWCLSMRCWCGRRSLSILSAVHGPPMSRVTASFDHSVCACAGSISFHQAKRRRSVGCGSARFTSSQDRSSIEASIEEEAAAALAGTFATSSTSSARSRASHDAAAALLALSTLALAAVWINPPTQPSSIDINPAGPTRLLTCIRSSSISESSSSNPRIVQINSLSLTPFGIS